YGNPERVFWHTTQRRAVCREHCGGPCAPGSLQSFRPRYLACGICSISGIRGPLIYCNPKSREKALKFFTKERPLAIKQAALITDGQYCRYFVLEGSSAGFT